MTGANVKDLSSLMTFVGPQANMPAPNAKSDVSFGDVMTKAQGGQSKAGIDSKAPQPKKADTQNAGNKLKGSRKADVKESAPAKPEGEKKGISPEETEALNEKGQELVKAIADELEVDVEEVTEAMENLGLSPIALLDTSNIGDVVLSLSEESDPMALVTNEELFNTVQDLNAIADAALVDLAEDMDIEVSDVSDLIAEAANIPYESVKAEAASEMQMSVETNSEPEKVNEVQNERVKVDIRVNGEDAEVTTDEKGNVIKTEAVTAEKPEFKEERGKKGNKDAESGDDSLRHEFQHGATTQINLNNENMNTEEVQNVPNQGFLSGQSREIMDQIMDGMKVNIRPDMEELELSLHPASLGNVKINLVNKGGEISAEFKVQNELVKSVVEAQLNELKEQFRDTGVKIDAVEVSVETQSFEQNLWQGEERNAGSEQGRGQRRPRRINLGDLDAGLPEDMTDEEALTAEMMAANGNTVDYTA